MTSKKIVLNLALVKTIIILLIMNRIAVIYKLSIVNYKIKRQKLHIIFILPIVGNRGPAVLSSSYRKSFKYLSSFKCLRKYFKFTIREHILLKELIAYSNKTNTIIWFLFDTYFSLLSNDIISTEFKNVIYGPSVTPKIWNKFPLNNTYEMNWSKCIKKIFAYVVQSERVKYYLLKKSCKAKNMESKYIISQGCIFVSESHSITEWNNRKIDILIFIKFADINRKDSAYELIKDLKRSYTIYILEYGNYNKNELIRAALNSKILIYYSFYDCWPSALMEMENLGIYPIVQQCEFIGFHGTCIKRIDSRKTKVIIEIGKIMNKSFNSLVMSSYYINKNNCNNVLKDTLYQIYYKKSKKTINCL